MITVVIIALVLCAWFLPTCPKVLKDNKQMLLGVLIGLLMGKYLPVRIEGMDTDEYGIVPNLMAGGEEEDGHTFWYDKKNTGPAHSHTIVDTRLGWY